jgi:hypothetical protein
MPRQFAHSTAELVVQAVDAVQANQKATVGFVEAFCALSKVQAENALKLAVDLGLLIRKGAEYEPSNPMVRFISTPDEARKAALLQIVLESYQPFVLFRERLLATNSPDSAALQTKTILDLDAHREEIKDTLISLGTYCSALVSQGGGRYTAVPNDPGNPLLAVASAARDEASAEQIIRSEIGARADTLDRQEVIIPLASALLKAMAGNAPGAVGDAARAVESFLARLADRMGVSLVGAAGIGQKLDKFRPGNHLPKKTVEAAKYLAQIRNAADHGVDVDPDVGSVWHIQRSTGMQYVFVVCAFITAALEREAGGQFLI